MTQVFLLDNFDSFTYNLVDELRSLGFELRIFRNNLDADFILDEMEQTPGDKLLLLSPGPGAPAEAGCMPQLIAKAVGKYPILGICLGHQAIVEHYGGKVGHAGETVHGKVSYISHSAEHMFEGLSQPMPVARYHNLMATQVPTQLEVIAKFEDVPMAVINANDKVLGFQFHPESILTTDGATLLAQSISYLCQTQG